MLYCGLGCSFHEIRHQNIHQPLTGKVAGMDTNVILPQLLEFLQAKDLALFRFFPVALCQALGDNLLPFLQELLRVLEVIVLSVKVGSFLPYRAVWLHLKSVVRLVISAVLRRNRIYASCCSMRSQ